jgi:Na+-translocating ferredoxin:NAD+ oxidoreductase subunit G
MAAAITVTAQGYGGPIEMLVAVDASGELAGARVLAHHETPAFAAGLAPAADLAAIDQRTGATITARAVTDGLRRAREYFAAHRERLLAGAP